MVLKMFGTLLDTVPGESVFVLVSRTQDLGFGLLTFRDWRSVHSLEQV